MEITLNLIVISLLIVTITFCFRLNKKIIELKNSRKDLGALVQTFDSAILKTHKSIADLKTMSQASSEELHQYVNKAGELISDLSFMTNTASKLADRLETSIGIARNEISNNNDNKPSTINNEEMEEMISQAPKNQQIQEKLTPEASYSSNSSKTKDELIHAIKKLKQT